MTEHEAREVMSGDCFIALYSDQLFFELVNWSWFHQLTAAEVRGTNRAGIKLVDGELTLLFVDRVEIVRYARGGRWAEALYRSLPWLPRFVDTLVEGRVVFRDVVEKARLDDIRDFLIQCLNAAPGLHAEQFHVDGIQNIERAVQAATSMKALIMSMQSMRVQPD